LMGVSRPDSSADASDRTKSGAVGAVSGMAPHLVHHAGLIAGTAFVSGVFGGLLFALLGVAVMSPMLLRLRRRTGSWRLPGAALGMFAAMFALMSALMASM